MTFQFQDKPGPSDLLSVSQGDLKQNFDYLQAALNKDHQIVFTNTNATTFEGRHRQVSLKNQSTPTPTDGSDGVIFSDTSKNLSWIPSGGSKIQITGPATNSANPGTVFVNGMTIKFGTQFCATNTTVLITFATAFANPPIVTIAPQVSPANLGVLAEIVGAPTAASFSVFSLGNITLHYIAIGT